MKIIYNIEDKYMYEILDDYRNEADEDVKNEIFKAFCSAIWESKNKRRVYKKDIRFNVRSDLIDTEIGQIFNIWSIITYTGYKPRTTDTDFVSLIRQKVNNIYTNMFDSRVILKKEYMDLIKTPKNLYYRWTKGDNFIAEELTKTIDDAINNSNLIKEKYAKEKMNLSWNEYKKLVEKYFRKMFDNFIPLDEYEKENEMILTIDTWCEDNYCIKYFCKGLNGYFKNYQKEYYGLYVPSVGKNKVKFKRCKKCGCLFKQKAPNQINCEECQKGLRKKYKATKEKERREKLRGQAIKVIQPFKYE